MTKKIEIEKEKLQTLVKYFYEACSLCDEMDIYEFKEGDDEMQKMKTWVNKNFGRDLEQVN
jgi:hypothetical protein